MHKYDTLLQKNSRNTLRVLGLLPEAERDLILEVLGKLQQAQSIYMPFMYQLTDALEAKGFEIDGTGDIGVALLGAFVHPQMREFYKWVVGAVKETQASMPPMLFATEEDVAEVQEKAKGLSMRLVRKFYHTLGLVFGVEFILSKADMAEALANQEDMEQWLEEFIPRAAKTLGYDLGGRFGL